MKNPLDSLGKTIGLGFVLTILLIAVLHCVGSA